MALWHCLFRATTENCKCVHTVYGITFVKHYFCSIVKFSLCTFGLLFSIDKSYRSVLTRNTKVVILCHSLENLTGFKKVTLGNISVKYSDK